MESIAQSTASPPTHASSGNGEGVEYRTLSVLAVASFVLGLASPLSLLAPLLLGIAFFGAAASIIALRRISTSDGSLAGRGVALIGLALCVASVGAVYSRAFATRQLLSHQAQAIALQWFELLQTGHAEEAFKFTPPRPTHSPDAESGEEPAGDQGESLAMKQFLEDPLVRAVASAGQEATVQWKRDLAIEGQRHGLGAVQQLFTVVPAGTGQAAFGARLTLVRTKEPGRDRPTWHISTYELEATPGTSTRGG